MSDELKNLMNETHLDENSCKLLLQFTGNDPEGVKRIIEAMPRDILVVKAKFVGQKTNRFGCFMVYYNLKTKTIERSRALIGMQKEIISLELSEDWEKYEQFIEKKMSESGVNAAEISRFLDKTNDPDFKQRFEDIVSAKEPNINELKRFFADEFFKILTDPNISVKIKTERIDQLHFHKGRGMDLAVPGMQSNPATPTGAGSGGGTGDEKPIVIEKIKQVSLVILECESVLSPLRGVPVSSLEYGDRILVKITDNREIGVYLAKLLRGIEQNQRVPVPGKITEITPTESGRISIIVEFGPGIIGRVVATNDLKVAMDTGSDQEDGASGPAVEGDGETVAPSAGKPFALNYVWVMVILGGMVLLLIVFALLSGAS